MFRFTTHALDLLEKTQQVTLVFYTCPAPSYAKSNNPFKESYSHHVPYSFLSSHIFQMGRRWSTSMSSSEASQRLMMSKW